jgi:hypothetical protein
MMHLRHLNRVERNRQKRDDFDAEQYRKFGSYDGTWECDLCGIMTLLPEDGLCSRCYDDEHEDDDAYGTLATQPTPAPDPAAVHATPANQTATRKEGF